MQNYQFFPTYQSNVGQKTKKDKGKCDLTNFIVKYFFLSIIIVNFVILIKYTQ